MTNARPGKKTGCSAGSQAFVLFVAGDEPNSCLARKNLADLFENELAESCDVEVIDVLEDTQRAIEYGVLLTPALLRLQPPPRLQIIGNLEDRRKVLAALER